MGQQAFIRMVICLLATSLAASPWAEAAAGLSMSACEPAQAQPFRFYFGEGIPSPPSPPPATEDGALDIPVPGLSFEDPQIQPDPAPPKESSPPPRPKESWFESRSGKIATAVIISGIILGVVIYALSQGDVYVVGDFGPIHVEGKRR